MIPQSSHCKHLHIVVCASESDENVGHGVGVVGGLADLAAVGDLLGVAHAVGPIEGHSCNLRPLARGLAVGPVPLYVEVVLVEVVVVVGLRGKAAAVLHIDDEVHHAK